MTDISAIAPKTVSRPSLQDLKTPMLRIGAPLAAMSALLGGAFKMAYADPYAAQRRRPQAAPDEDLDGRDPSW